jgi:hypothetical protein
LVEKFQVPASGQDRNSNVLRCRNGPDDCGIRRCHASFRRVAPSFAIFENSYATPKYGRNRQLNPSRQVETSTSCLFKTFPHGTTFWGCK